MMLLLKELRKKHKLSQQELAQKLGVTQATLSGWENEKFELDNSSLLKCAEIFQVSTDYLLGIESPCPLCGLGFTNCAEDKKIHEQVHNACVKAIERHGFYIPSNEWGEKKYKAYNVLYNKDASITEKIDAAEILLKIYFCRSLKKTGFDSEHPKLTEYISVKLKEKYLKELFSSVSVYEELIKKYGTTNKDLSKWISEDKQEQFEYEDDKINLNKYNPKIHKIPILGTIAAGLPIYAEQHIEDYTYTDRNHGAEYFALRVKGDSMNAASISEGSLLIVRRQENVENGEIAVVMVNDENATVKRFKKDGNIIQLIPQSYNPNHQIQIYNIAQDNIRIIGKVVECKTEF